MTPHKHRVHIAGCIRCECPTCDHPIVEHSSEPGVGCLHDDGSAPVRGALCPCLHPGTSRADQ